MNTPPPEITDPLLKSLSEDALDLPRMAAREARRVHAHKRSPRAGSSRHFRPLAGLVWLMQFRAAQAAVALLILAAMIEGGSLYTGERFPLARKKGVDLLTSATVTTKSGARTDIPIEPKLAFWTDDATGKVDVNTADEGEFQDTPVSGSTAPATDFDKVVAFGATVGGTGKNWSAFTESIGQLSPRISGDTGVNFVSTYYSRGILQGPQAKLSLVDGSINTVNSGAGDATINNSPVLTPAVIERSRFFLTANSKSPELNSGNTPSIEGFQPNPSLAGITFNSNSSQYSIGTGTTSVMDNGIAALHFNYSTGTGNIGNIQYSGGNTVSPTASFTGSGTLTTGSGTIARNVYPAGEQGDWDGPGWLSQTSQGKTVPIVGSGGSGYNITSGKTVVVNSGTVGQDLPDGGRAAAINPGESKTGGPIGAKRLENLKYFSQVQLQRPVSGSNSPVLPPGLLQNHPWETMTFRPAKPLILAQQTGAAKPGEQTPAPAQPATPAPADARKLIRNAALDFEVTSFESALDTVGKVAGEEQGYILTQNSAKGENGKLQGTIIVKVLPGNLDRFLLKLRALGDMKNQTVGGNDVTKDYYDTEARIRNSQVTEARLVEMMKTRTGKVSDLLEVENEIAKVRGEIEQMQGQLKYYDGLVQYATVTITLQEKDINQAAAYLLTQRAQLSLFAKDVDAALAEAKTDADAAKAQTLDSHIERNESGQEVATLHLLLPPENADAAIMKLKAIGRIQNFNSQTQRVAKDAGDDAAPSDTAKVDRDKVDISILIQRDAENAVQGTNISVQTDQVDEKTRQIKEAAAAVGVEVKGAEFNRMHNGVEISAMLLRMPMKKYAAFIEQIKSLGKVKDFTVARREDSTATDDAPAEIVLQIFSQGNIVAPDTGLWVTVRHTLGEGMSALMWSLRMIGVSLAWIAPWAVIAGLVGWGMARRRRRAAKKQG